MILNANRVEIGARVFIHACECVCVSLHECGPGQGASQLTVFLDKILINVFVRLLAKLVNVRLVCGGPWDLHVMARAKRLDKKALHKWHAHREGWRIRMRVHCKCVGACACVCVCVCVCVCALTTASERGNMSESECVAMKAGQRFRVSCMHL